MYIIIIDNYCFINFSELFQVDKGAAMTLIYQESSIGHMALCPQDETVIAYNSKNRVLFHKKTQKTMEKRVTFPLVYIKIFIG